MKTGLSLILVLLTLCCLAACGPRDAAEPQRPGTPAVASPAPPTEPPAERPAPSWKEAAGATYAGLFDSGEVTLVDGRWEGNPYVEGGASAPRAGLVEDFLLRGDLDGDGADESVVLLWTSTGGSGTFDYLAALDRAADGSALNRATVPLGDRVRVRNAGIESGRVVLDLVEAGPEDAACCPGDKVRRTYQLDGESLAEQDARQQGRLSLADLSGEWRLTHFGPGEPAGAGLDITLTFDGDRIGGGSGCNRYNGAVTGGEAPGAISVNQPLAATRMACPEPQMTAEQRYLQALANVGTFSFRAGRLVLTWNDGSTSGNLLFARQEAPASGS